MHVMRLSIELIILIVIVSNVHINFDMKAF